jgi:hypothetical protein
LTHLLLGVLTNPIPAAFRRKITLWFGINGALILAVVTATLGLIPVVGPLFALLMIFTAARSGGSTHFIGLDNFAFAVLTIIADLIVTQASSTIVSPKLKGSAINDYAPPDPIAWRASWLN